MTQVDVGRRLTRGEVYGAVESAFSQVFFDDIYTPAAHAEILRVLGPGATHYLGAFRHRKFRAVLPWLSIPEADRSREDCLLAEVLFAVFYCMDDLVDTPSDRYGVPTGYGVLGAPALAATVAAACAPWSADTAPVYRSPAWSGWIAETVAGQEAKIALPVPSVVGPEAEAEYRRLSQRRVAFVGAAWQHAFAAAGMTDAAGFVARTYPACALAGQLRNDLRDGDARAGARRHSDFARGRATAVTLSVLRTVDARDRAWIHDRVWRRASIDAATARYLDDMLTRSQVVPSITAEIATACDTIRTGIGTAGFTPDVVAIWEGWVVRQFETGLGEDQRATAFADGELEAIIGRVRGGEAAR